MIVSAKCLIEAFGEPMQEKVVVCVLIMVSYLMTSDFQTLETMIIYFGNVSQHMLFIFCELHAVTMLVSALGEHNNYVMHS